MVMVDQDLTSVFEKYPKARREHLIPILQQVQEKIGFLSKEAMEQVGNQLDLPVSKVYGVATFYNQFRFQPQGKVHCQVCRGTACHVKGSDRLLSSITHNMKVEPGKTTKDGSFSLEVVACIGACGLAPVVTLNGEFIGSATADRVCKTAKRMIKAEKTDGNK